MKRMIIFTAVVATAGAAYLGSKLLAQGQIANAQSPGQSRIGVVNMGKVFHEYKKAQELKREVERVAKPIKDEIEKVIKLQKDWETYVQQNGPKLTLADKEKADKTIRECIRRREDLTVDLQKKVGKKSEEMVIQLWDEVSDAIKACAQSTNFQLILGYHEPVANEIPRAANIERKLQGMNMGCNPMFITSGVDITTHVVNTLNKSK